jgi:hypothetical protein
MPCRGRTVWADWSAPPTPVSTSRPNGRARGLKSGNFASGGVGPALVCSMLIEKSVGNGAFRNASGARTARGATSMLPGRIAEGDRDQPIQLLPSLGCLEDAHAAFDALCHFCIAARRASLRRRTRARERRNAGAHPQHAPHGAARTANARLRANPRSPRHGPVSRAVAPAAHRQCSSSPGSRSLQPGIGNSASKDQDSRPERRSKKEKRRIQTSR